MKRRLRPLAPSDGPALAVLHRRAILAVRYEIYTAAERESWAAGIDPDAYARIAVETETFIIAEVAETAIGFTSFRLHDDGTGEICGLYVDPAAQGTGHGRTLLLEAEAALFAERARGLVVSSSLSGRPFYTHLGYVDDDAAEYRTRGGLVVEVRRMRKSRLAAALRLEPGEPFAHGHDGLIGTVVVNLESGRAAPGWGSEGWGDGGLMVETGEAGTVHYPLATLQPLEDEAGAEGALRG